MNIKEKAKQLKTDIPSIFLALKHKSTPVNAKIIAGITIAYALSPIDLIPDFIPVFGYIDDVILLPLLIALTIKLIPDDVMNECRIKAEGMWSDGKPKKWFYAIPILIIWLIVLLFIIKLIIKKANLSI